MLTELHVAMWPQWVNTLRLRQNGIFKCIFLNRNFRVSNKISLKYVPWGLADNKWVLVQIVAWYWANTWTNDVLVPSEKLCYSSYDVVQIRQVTENIRTSTDTILAGHCCVYHNMQCWPYIEQDSLNWLFKSLKSKNFYFVSNQIQMT